MSGENFSAPLEAEVVDKLPTVAPARAVGSPLDLPTARFASALKRRGENRKLLLEWLREALVEGVDFGKIHVVKKTTCALGNNCTNAAHFSKPVLFKPGAEKICGMLGVVATFPALGDYERAALEGRTLGHIILRCHLVTATGEVVADGVGGRSPDQDGDLNKALKMCAKSAHIDATLRMAGLSEIFTQDLEDMKLGEDLTPGGPGGQAGVGETKIWPLTGVAGEAKSSTFTSVPTHAVIVPTRVVDAPPPHLQAVGRGKYAQMVWADVPGSYLEWAVDAPNAPQSLRAAALEELNRRRALEAAHEAQAVDPGEGDNLEDLPEGFYGGTP